MAAPKSLIGENTPTRQLQAHLHEPIKMHHGYDVTNRMIVIYVAVASAANGDSCVKTSYSYDGTSTRIVGMKEELATWDSSWDI